MNSGQVLTLNPLEEQRRGGPLADCAWSQLPRVAQQVRATAHRLTMELPTVIPPPGTAKKARKGK